jgi:hypothetical protein
MRPTIANARLLIALTCCTGLLGACGSPTAALPTEQQIRDAAWTALEPNTSSHNRTNWEFVQVKQVKGQEISSKFDGRPSAGCWMGPTPSPNEAISPAGSYWYVELKPHPATPVPRNRTVSATEPPAVPEPFLRQALILLDVSDSKIVARKLFCVVY